MWNSSVPEMEPMRSRRWTEVGPWVLEEQEESTMTTVESVVEDAQRIAMEKDTAELAGDLQGLLGQKLVAYAVGDKHPKTIGRYARSEREPDDSTRERLINLGIVVEVLRAGMHEGTVKNWLLGSNQRLKGRAPIAVFHDGHMAEVIGAAKAFVTRR